MSENAARVALRRNRTFNLLIKSQFSLCSSFPFNPHFKHLAKTLARTEIRCKCANVGDV